MTSNVKYINYATVYLAVIAFSLISNGLGASDAPVREGADGPLDTAEDDSFDHEYFGDAKKMRVILGDTAGWVNHHDMFGNSHRKKTPDRGAKRRSQASGAARQHADDEPISEDTVTAKTRAELFSKVRARAAADGKKFSRNPDSTQDDHNAEADDVAADDVASLGGTSRQKCDCDCKSLQRECRKCDENLQRLRLRHVLVDDTRHDQDREFVYLRRLALNVVYSARFGRKVMPSIVKLEILLSPEDVSALEKLAQQKDTMASQLEQHLSSMIASSTVISKNWEEDTGLSYVPGQLMRYLAQSWGQVAGTARPLYAVPALGVLGVLLCIAVRGARWNVRLVAAASYFMSITFVWHWVHCYQVETARRAAYVSRHDVLPDECRPGYAPGWLSWSWRSVDVNCEKYFEALHVDPVWQLNPLFVFSELITKALFQPLTFLGDYLGRFTRDFASHQTWWGLAVLPVVSICFVIAGAAALSTVLFLLRARFLPRHLWSPRVPRERRRVEEVPLEEFSGGGKQDDAQPPMVVGGYQQEQSVGDIELPIKGKLWQESTEHGAGDSPISAKKDIGQTKSEET